jgi:hypothetical protein
MAQIIILTGTAAFVNIRAIGAYQIASTLRNAGYTVQVVEHFPVMLHTGGLELVKKVLSKFIDKDTLWIGLSTTFFFPNMIAEREIQHSIEPRKNNSVVLFSDEEKIELKDYVRNINSKIKWVAGGSRAWMTGGGHPLIDCYIEGYADVTALEYTKYLQGKNPFLSFRKNSNGSISIIHDRKGSLFNFVDHKFAWHDTDLIRESEPLPIEISRGCIFRCKFCSYPLNGKKKLDYIKDPEILYNEFMENYEKFKTTNYVFLDDTYNDSPYKVELLYEKVFSRLPFKINWGSYIRLDLLAAHPETIDIIRESGLKVAFFGIESLNYKSNKAIGKGFKPEKITETLTLVREKWPDATLQGGFILGLPHDSEESIREWFDVISQPEYPLDAIAMTVLQIFPKYKKEMDASWLNEMEKDPEKFGYTFEDTRDIIWKNNTGLTKLEAVELHKEFMQILYKNEKVKWGWGASFGLLNLGYKDIKEVQTSQASEIYYDPDKFIEKGLVVVDDYVKKLLD